MSDDDKVLTPEEQEAATKAAMELAKEEAAKEEAIKEAAKKAAKEVPEVGANSGEVFHCQYSEPGGAGARCGFHTHKFEMLLYHDKRQHSVNTRYMETASLQIPKIKFQVEPPNYGDIDSLND